MQLQPRSRTRKSADLSGIRLRQPPSGRNFHPRALNNKAIIIAGDDDRGLKNNPGREKALATAEAAASIAIFPNFSAEQHANG
jgi:hypothetical protein